MITIKSNNILWVDVDETLVFWGAPEHPTDEVIKVADPYLDGERISLVKHTRNIDLLKRNKAQGRYIVVWSAGGTLHAEAVVKALKLESYVDLVISKPFQYVDDIDMKDWGCKRVYLHKEFREHYKGEDIDETNV